MDERFQAIQEFKRYLERRASESRTSIDYVSDVRQFANACPKPWREVTMHDIDTFVDQQRQAGLSAATVKRRVAALKVFFDFLAEETDDLSWPNPVRFKRHAGKQPKRLPRDLSNEQVEQLWAVITTPRDQAWFALMLRAGLRVGEVSQLKVTDLLRPPTANQPGQLQVFGKGQKERAALVTADAYAVLQEWLRVRPVSAVENIFLNYRGQPLRTNGIEWLLGRYSQQALGLHVTPHQLRHTFSRQLIEAGMPITSLSKLLGHTEVSTTQVYTGGTDPELVQAYQTAMARLTSWSLPKPEPPSEPQPIPQQPAPPSFPSPPAPDWEAWATHLPANLRQASLDMVQRLWPTWKPQRREAHTRRILNQLLGFWNWQLSHRPITQLAELHLTDLQAYQQARTAAGKAASTINRALSHVMAVIRLQADQGQPIDASVFRLRPLPRPDSLPRHLSETDIQKLERFVRDRFNSSDPLIRLENACFFVLAHSGLRASECIDLQHQDLDLNASRLMVRLGKGQRDRLVPLSDTTHQTVQIYLSQVNAALTTPLWLHPTTKRPITAAWLYHHIVALGQTAGEIVVSPNRLRHTLATRLLNAGMEITRIQKLLGHENINTTMIYARVLDTTLEADYRQAMRKIENQQTPLSTTPEVISNWPIPQTNPQPELLEGASIVPDHSVSSI
jgi:site-specific recombinase XerD